MLLPRIYTRLSLEEREEISRGLAQGYSYRDLGKKLGRARSTVSREVKRCPRSPLGYRAVSAQRKAQRSASKRKLGRRKLLMYKVLQEEIHRGLRNGWSPNQIAKRLMLTYPEDTSMRVSPETIYSYIYILPKGNLKKELILGLRREHQYRRNMHKRRNSPTGKRGHIRDMLSIEERPKEVADRIVPGHWEGDLVLGRHKYSALGTLVERTTRYTLLIPLKTKDAVTVRKCFVKVVNHIPQDLRQTLTYDQGMEMAEHQRFSQETKMQVYFAHPSSPWERGTNENTNGLIRQYFPKGTDFHAVSSKEILRVQNLLNERPRETLRYYTPKEKFNELVALDCGE
jgi:transposase, IS30 family